MAFVSTRKSSLLGDSFVLAPERYDPRRTVEANDGCIPLREIANISRSTVHALSEEQKALVLDTSDAREGIIVAKKSPTSEIGSAKKLVEPGNVIISRLRPYLRQVAFVDSAITNGECQLLCSTEFFVLQAIDKESIAFLVPYLLTTKVQTILAASQEGGHHPRFNESVLSALPIPKQLLDDRKKASRIVEESVKFYRRSEKNIEELVSVSNQCVENSL